MRFIEFTPRTKWVMWSSGSMLINPSEIRSIQFDPVEGKLHVYIPDGMVAEYQLLQQEELQKIDESKDPRLKVSFMDDVMGILRKKLNDPDVFIIDLADVVKQTSLFEILKG
nr:MAG TPA: KTSC domain [Caudoviricetes sp.]